MKEESTAPRWMLQENDENENEIDEILFGEPDFPPILMHFATRFQEAHPLFECFDAIARKQILSNNNQFSINQSIYDFVLGSENSTQNFLFLSQFVCFESCLYRICIRNDLKKTKMWWKEYQSVYQQNLKNKVKWLIGCILSASITAIATQRICVAKSWKAMRKENSLLSEYRFVAERNASWDGIYAYMAELVVFNLAKELILKPLFQRKKNNIESNKKLSKNQNGNDNRWLVKNLLGHLLINTISKLIVYPISTVRNKMNCRKLSEMDQFDHLTYYQDEFDCISKVYKNNGISSFYSGVDSTLTVR